MIEINTSLTRGRFNLEAELKLNSRVTGLFGPSGSGKSTLLNMVAGLVRPNRGKVLINGLPLFDSDAGINLPLHQRRIGLVFQDSRLFPHLTVKDNLEYGYRLLKKQEQIFSFKLITGMLELEKLLDQKPYQLSGGEKQRVALGRALLSSPRLLLLDEPLASLDSRLKDQILPFLKRVADEINIPMIYVSHSINEILYLTSNVAFIEDGRILAYGGFHEALHSEKVLQLAHSLGLENVLSVNAITHEDALGYSLVEHFGRQIVVPLIVPAKDTVTISIRASNIALSNRPIEGTTIQNQIAGTVVELRTVGSRVLVSIDIGSVILAEVSLKAIHELSIAPGTGVYCLIKAQSISVL